MKEELLKLGRDLLGNRFEIAEYEFGRMPSVYRSCDIFLSASLPHYSFEMVLLEAMASGLPVVANNDPIRKEIVGDAGILIDPTINKIYSESVKNKEKQYIPNPSTWFHQERWKDCIESESHRHITPQVAL